MKSSDFVEGRSRPQAGNIWKPVILRACLDLTVLLNKFLMFGSPVQTVFTCEKNLSGMESPSLLYHVLIICLTNVRPLLTSIGPTGDAK